MSFVRWQKHRVSIKIGCLFLTNADSIWFLPIKGKSDRFRDSDREQPDSLCVLRRLIKRDAVIARSPYPPSLKGTRYTVVAVPDPVEHRQVLARRKDRDF